MSFYFNKYIKYKTKYLQSIGLVGGSLRSRRSVSDSSRNVGNNVLNIDEIVIPKKYKKNSLIEQINQEDLHPFYEIYHKFTADKAIVDFASKYFDKGELKVTTKENKGKNYILTIVPVIVINYTKRTICWSWVNTLVKNVPHYVDKISAFQKNMQKYIDELNYLNFDCIYYGNHMDKFDQLIYDIILVSMHVLNAKGFIKLEYPKPHDEIVEYFFITKISPPI